VRDESISKAQQGDHEAFREIVEEYTPLVWRIAWTLLPNKESIEDTLQETWIDVWHGLPGFHSGKPFRPWLIAIVANRCRMMTRRHEVATITLETADLNDVADADDLLNNLVSSEEEAHLRTVVATLTVEQQQLLKLRFFADLGLAEIALVTGIPLGTVKSRLHRTLIVLRSQLQLERSITQSMEK
jgi:RNA polymerase sigma factor (sigma-70 family)